MKKSVKKRGGAAARPPRSPVIAIRVPAPVYEAVMKEAKKAGMTLSEYVQQLISRGREMQGIIGSMQAQEKPDEMTALDARITDEIQRRVEAELTKRGVR